MCFENIIMMVSKIIVAQSRRLCAAGSAGIILVVAPESEFIGAAIDTATTVKDGYDFYNEVNEQKK